MLTNFGIKLIFTYIFNIKLLYIWKLLPYLEAFFRDALPYIYVFNPR